MNIKVAVVLLLAIVVAFVLVLFFGAVRPQPSPGAPADGPAGWFAGLLPSTPIESADLQGEQCFDSSVPGLTVPSTGCALELPEGDRITVCAIGAGDLTLSLRGDDYPAQEFDPGDLPECDTAEPMRIDLYDEQTVLRVTCAVAGGCAVRVVDDP